MNKIQVNFCKIINQYVKETYPNDETLKYLLDGIDNFTDKNIQTEVDKPKYLCSPISESLLNDKDRIKEIMNKILDVNFKPNGAYVKPNDIFIDEDKNIPTDEIRYNTNLGSTSGTSGTSGMGSTSGDNYINPEEEIHYSNGIRIYSTSGTAGSSGNHHT